MNRRSFLRGLAALPLLALIPADALLDETELLERNPEAMASIRRGEQDTRAGRRTSNPQPSDTGLRLNPTITNLNVETYTSATGTKRYFYWAASDKPANGFVLEEQREWS